MHTYTHNILLLRVASCFCKEPQIGPRVRGPESLDPRQRKYHSQVAMFGCLSPATFSLRHTERYGSQLPEPACHGCALASEGSRLRCLSCLEIDVSTPAALSSSMRLPNPQVVSPETGGSKPHSSCPTWGKGGRVRCLLAAASPLQTAKDHALSVCRLYPRHDLSVGGWWSTDRRQIVPIQIKTSIIKNKN